MQAGAADEVRRSHVVLVVPESSRDRASRDVSERPSGTVTEESTGTNAGIVKAAAITLPPWAPALLERGSFFASSFLAANRAGCNERRPLPPIAFMANICRVTEAQRGEALARQPLSRWAVKYPVYAASATPLLRRAARDGGRSDAASKRAGG